MIGSACFQDRLVRDSTRPSDTQYCAESSSCQIVSFEIFFICTFIAGINGIGR